VLAVRQATGAAALNPLYGFGAAPYADAFLAMGLALAAALNASWEFMLHG
jgi:hypothetical protein